MEILCQVIWEVYRMDIKDFEVQNLTKCECGHEFVIEDMADLKRLYEKGFYSNVIKHCSITNCPNCNKETLLLLKQKGQTYEILDIAIRKENKVIVQEPRKAIEQEITTSDECICNVCGKVCKNQIGLNAHMRTHQN